MKTHGNKTVEAVGRMNLEGNIIPQKWYKALTFESGKPDLVSIIILADLVYWHRPTEIRDEYTGQVVEVRKKFKADLLQRDYESYANLLGITKRQARESIIRMEERGILKRVFRTVETRKGPLSNVLFIDLNAAAIEEMTFKGTPMTLKRHTPMTLERHTPPHSNVAPYDIETSDVYKDYSTKITNTKTYQTGSADKEKTEPAKPKNQEPKPIRFKDVSLAYQMHITHNIGPRTADTFNHWEQDADGNLDLILYAIERTQERIPGDGYKSKERFVSMLLRIWKENGIKDREAAKAFEETPKNAKGKPAGKEAAEENPYMALIEEGSGE